MTKTAIAPPVIAPPVIAIDGPAAAGKGTLAKRLAASFGLPYLDTGLLYRAVGRRVVDRGADPRDAVVAEEEARALTAEDLARGDLRGPVADSAASAVAAIPAVRAALVAFQRRFGAERGAVLDGRDIGTVIMPDARVKLFVTASPEARAERRWRELAAAGQPHTLAQVLADIRARDARDTGRAHAPLARAADAVLLETSNLDKDAAVQQAIDIVTARMNP